MTTEKRYYVRPMSYGSGFSYSNGRFALVDRETHEVLETSDYVNVRILNLKARKLNSNDDS